MVLAGQTSGTGLGGNALSCRLTTYAHSRARSIVAEAPRKCKPELGVPSLVMFESTVLRFTIYTTPQDHTDTIPSWLLYFYPYECFYLIPNVLVSSLMNVTTTVEGAMRPERTQRLLRFEDPYTAHSLLCF